ncbi:hypothetical protein [Haladaptatus halobius]|uniref:hypothetical protein n=1 Tax=Haladaptatus halobius TaxID=2884875 RepID=UPI001D0AD0BA|nr:hypothetical protein [Haladaptatus halobius]
MSNDSEMRFVRRMGLDFGSPGPARFECKGCGTPYELDRQVCTECGGCCIGYRDSWLERELGERASRPRTY